MSVPRFVRLPSIAMPALIALIALVGMGVSLALLPPVARGANETATASLSIKSHSGHLYRQKLSPVNLGFGVNVVAPYPASPKILPMKQVTVDFPTDIRFTPKKGLPVCPASQIGPKANLSVPPQTAIARCPKAVIGNGTAELYLAGVNLPGGPNLKDPVLVAFNGGRTSAGLPRIRIYGFSKGTGVGVYMGGVLQKDGTLSVSIPVLTADSAVGNFDLEIPATKPIVYDSRSVPGSVGLDRSYVQARCSTGSWNMSADFVLGTRNDLGEPTSPDSDISAPPVTENCVGAAGHPRLKRVKVVGPNKLKRGQKRMFKVRVTNNGTAVAKGIKAVVRGKWIRTSTRKTADLWPGSTRWVKVPVKLTRKAKRNRATVARFRVSAAQTKAKVGKKRIRVR